MARSSSFSSTFPSSLTSCLSHASSPTLVSVGTPAPLPPVVIRATVCGARATWGPRVVTLCAWETEVPTQAQAAPQCEFLPPHLRVPPVMAHQSQSHGACYSADPRLHLIPETRGPQAQAPCRASQGTRGTCPWPRSRPPCPPVFTFVWPPAPWLRP